MIDTKLIDEIRKLSTSERFTLLEFTFSLLKEDFEDNNDKKDSESEPFSGIAARIATASERVAGDGAQILPIDLASRHDAYLYGESS